MNGLRDPTADPTALRSGVHVLPVDDASGQGPTTSILVDMSAERDELRRLVEELPDERVPAVLEAARRQSIPEQVPEWPPAWFGSFASGRRDLGSNHDDLLAEGFGR